MQNEQLIQNGYNKKEMQCLVYILHARFSHK
jgi:hypothetical protein